MSVRPHSAHASGVGLGDGDMAVWAVPDGQLVPPPELPRDVPVGRVLERVDGEAVLRRRVVADTLRLKSLDRRRTQLVHAAPPLERDERLDPALAALADGDRVAIGLALLEQASLLAPGEHALAGFLLVEPRELAGLVRHEPVGADHHRLGQAVGTADLEVRGVVAGRHLERARAELGLDALVRDHRHAPFDEGDDDLLANQGGVTLVLRVHGDGDVREDRRRPHGRDRHVARAVGERVADVDELVVDLDVVKLEIRERAEVERAPVDDAVVAVEPAALPKVDEELQHRADIAVVHREALAPIVHRGAHAPELPHDRLP